MRVPTPVTRREIFLSAMADGARKVPEKPLTREELYLQAILQAIPQGGGGGHDVQIASIDPIEGGHRVTFSFYKDGKPTTSHMDVMDGYSPSIKVKESTDSSYVLTVNNRDGSYDTPNLKGAGSNMRVEDDNLIFS